MIRIVLWDLNDTLIDDWDAWEAARCATFRSQGVEPPDYPQYRTALAACNGDYVKIYERFGVFATSEELNEVYNREYIKGLLSVKLHRDAALVLRELAYRNIPCGIISTQSAEPFDATLQRFPALRARCFATLHDVLDKAHAIRLLCGMRGITPKYAMYVGDTQSDMRHAKNAGAYAVFFRNRNNRDQIVNDPEPDQEISSLKTVLSIVDQKTP